ncbi:MAG: hypothetical protein NUV64_03545 [Parcubacteria group bacterium]|nr:hypothetical protein [Parcubacteria group bacterium]MCR4342339.1 hypothetical protein [Patescibacteria group bacterium]
MFDKLRQLKQMKDISRDIQNEKITVEEEGTRVVINGAFMAEEILLNQELNKEKQEIVLKNCFNKAVKQAQMAVAQKFSGLM